MPESPRGDVDQCIALTNAGTRCTRPANDDGFCYQHDESDDTVEVAGEFETVDEGREGTEVADEGQEGAEATDWPSPAAGARQETPSRERHGVGGGTEVAAADVAGTLQARLAALVEELRDHRRYRDARRRLEHGGETAVAVGRERTRAARRWITSEVSPALRSAREELRRLRTRITDGLSTNRK